MKRYEYIRCIESELLKITPNNAYLSKEEREAAIRYCEEYLDDAGIDEADEVPSELESPSHFAASVAKAVAEDAVPTSFVNESEQTVNPTEPFHSASISVISSNIIFEMGSGFGITIDYSPNVPLPKVSVTDGVLSIEDIKQIKRKLTFFTGFGISSAVNNIVITVPPQSFKDFDVSTFSGKILIPALAIEKIDCSTVNGRTELTGVIADKLACDTVNGSIVLVDCYSHNKLSASTVNGSVRINGELRGKLSASTVNGSVNLVSTLPLSSYNLDLSTVSGSVTINGEKHRRSASVKHFDAKYSISASTVNGSIKCTCEN